jgi:hypothetical protein
MLKDLSKKIIIPKPGSSNSNKNDGFVFTYHEEPEGEPIGLIKNPSLQGDRGSKLTKSSSAAVVPYITTRRGIVFITSKVEIDPLNLTYDQNKDIDIILSQTTDKNISRDKAIKAYIEMKGDVVNAIMSFYD